MHAALWIGHDGRGFIRLVNFLQAIPGLRIIECTMIGLPILVHTVWGIRRAWTARTNSWRSDGSKPSLTHYLRNHAFTWQRLSAWILIVGIGFHVVQMRFVNHPHTAILNGTERFLVRVSADPGLFTLAQRLNVSLYPINDQQLTAAAPDRGTAMLLTMRDTFKHPLMSIFYSIFVACAAFHAFNGFWTFLITWGVIVSVASQKAVQRLSVVGMIILAVMGMLAIWATFWLNLRH